MYARDLKKHPEWRFQVLPGVCPKIMTAAHVRSIVQCRKEWMVGPKSDGERLLVLIRGPKILFYNRSFENVLAFENPNFVNNTTAATAAATATTVLDGEMMKSDKGNHFVLHDGFLVEGVSITELAFNIRLKMAAKFCKNIQHKLTPNIAITTKTFLEATSENIRGVRNGLKQGVADGLIFVNIKHAAHNQKDDVVIKWKPRHECLVDFLVANDGVTLQLHNNDAFFVAGRMGSSENGNDDDNTPLDLSGYVAEFKLNGEGEWVFVRKRLDRRLPNSASSAFQTMTFSNCCEQLYSLLIN